MKLSDFRQPDIQDVSKSYQRDSATIFSILQKDISFGTNQLGDKYKEMFYKELGTLIQSGVDIKTALDLSIFTFVGSKREDLFRSLQDQVVKGMPLSEALKSKEKFSEYEFFSVRIGEETGRLAEVLLELAKFYKAKISQRRKIISALTYPILVLATSFAAIFFMIKFVVPMFADVFKRFGGKLPVVTAFILDISNAFDRYFYGLLLMIILVLIGYFIVRKSYQYRSLSSRVVLKIPVIGEIVRKIYLARFANTMRLLTGTNTPLLKAIGMVKEMIGFHPITVSLELATQDLLLGKTLSDTLAKNNFYPPKFIQVIKIAEEVNKLEYFFGELAQQYTEEVEYQTQALSSLMEPLIIIFLGIAVGVILIAMYLPMFQMSHSF